VFARWSFHSATSFLNPVSMILLPLDELGFASGDDRRLGTVLGLQGH
jgi:hypothetical protein